MQTLHLRIFPKIVASAGPGSWESFVPGGVMPNAPWEQGDIHDYFTSVPDVLGAAHPLILLQRYIEGSHIPKSRFAHGRGLVIGFGREGMELTRILETYGLDHVEGIEMIGARVEYVGRLLARAGVDPRKISLHHGEAQSRLAEIADRSIAMIYGEGLELDRGNIGAQDSILNQCLRILTPGGILRLDNISWMMPQRVAPFGRVLCEMPLIFEKANSFPQ